MSQEICSTIVRTKTISIHVFVEQSRLPGNALSRESLKRKKRECEEEYNETPLWRFKRSNERESNNERFSEMTNAIWYRTSREDKDIDWHVRVTGKVASLIHSTIPSSPEAFPPASLYFTWTLLTEDFECFIFFRVISLSRSDGNCTLVRFVSMESVLNIRVSFLWKKTIDFEIHLDKT